MPDTPRHPRHRDVAVAALVDGDKRVLLVRTRRLPQFWQPVGGGVEPGDGGEPRNTATRELREELGLDLPEDALQPSLETPYDFGQGTVHFFVAHLPEMADLDIDDHEILEMSRFKVSEAIKLPAYPATKRFLEHLGRQLDERPAEPACSNGSAGAHDRGMTPGEPGEPVTDRERLQTGEPMAT